MATQKKSNKSASKKAPAKKAPAAAKKAPAKKAAPAAKPAAKAKGEPTSQDLANFLGVKLHKPLGLETIRHFRRALPGYMDMLPHVAKTLENEKVSLGLDDVTPAALRNACTSLEHLHAVEDVAEAVYRSIYEERLQVDDEAMGMLHALTRRIGAISEDHPDLLTRWKFLRDFLAHFHGGGRPAGSTKAADAPADETAEG